MSARGLEWLLSPLSVAEFLREFWEREPHLIKRDQMNYYDGLFSGEDLDAILRSDRLKPPDLRVLSEGTRISPDKYVQSNGRLDFDQLRMLYGAGHSIVLHGLHRLWDPIAEFVQALQRRFNCKVNANAYLTPTGSRALAPHYDTHDVFILQLAGTKTWRIYDAVKGCRLLDTDRPGVSPDPLPQPRVVELQEGNAIYIPRGCIHDAATAGESSLHLTVGVQPTQWDDFIADLRNNIRML